MIKIFQSLTLKLTLVFFITAVAYVYLLTIGVQRLVYFDVPTERDFETISDGDFIPSSAAR